MANGKERQRDVRVLIRHHPPRQILHHTVVFILSGAIISVEKDVLLSKAVIVEEEVQPTDHSIGTLTAITCLVCQEVDLPGECLAVDTKHGTLPGCQEVDRSRLQGV